MTGSDLGRTMKAFALVDEARRIRPELPETDHSGNEQVPPGRVLGANERCPEKPCCRQALSESPGERSLRGSGASLPP